MPIVLLLFAGMSETFFSHTTPCQCCRQMELGRPAYFLLATTPSMGPDEAVSYTHLTLPTTPYV